MQNTNRQSKRQSAPLRKILLAIFYDVFLLGSVIFVAFIPTIFIPDDNLPMWLIKTYRLSYLFLITFGFYGWFWTHGGQTIGMRAWKIKLVNQHGNNPTWTQALARYCTAFISLFVLGLGFIWSLIDSDKQTWHDKTSATFIISLK